MAVIHQQSMPADVPLAMVDEVTDEMGVEADPPAGLIVHTHFEQDGRVHIVDVWESDEAFEEFGRSRLGPAANKVAAAHGIDMSQGEQPVSLVLPVHRLVRGR